MPIDTSKMTEQELQFHYFKMHDADNNNKLDGCELIKSLIHWHGEFFTTFICKKFVLTTGDVHFSSFFKFHKHKTIHHVVSKLLMSSLFW